MPSDAKSPQCLWQGDLKMRTLYRGPSIDASNQISVHLAKRFQKRYFRNRPIRNKNCLWRLCLLTDQNEMTPLDRGPSIEYFLPSFGSFGQEVSEVHLEIDKSEIRISSGGHVC